jgi:hypothetical protein
MDPALMTIIAAIPGALIAAVSQIMQSYNGKKAQHEIEHLKAKITELTEIDKLKKRYSIPLLKSAEELYNRLNDLIAYSHRSLSYFKELPSSIAEIRSLGEILSSPSKIYLTSTLYFFARYFGSVEALKKDIGLLRLASDVETKAFHLRLRQTVAVFFSGRLHYKIRIRQDDRLKHEGRILEGAQILIGEMMLRQKQGLHQCISFHEFCSKIATDQDFRLCLSPLLNLLSGLKDTFDTDLNSSEIDFRWTKFIIFSSFLRNLIEQIDDAKVVNLLPEMQQYAQKYFGKHKALIERIDYFRAAYPDPESRITIGSSGGREANLSS